ncbi:MAG: hypothetical protein JO222_02065, partial [Frankiales bacterium]|nr:hypothetical protein [Frankiales bacterium]
MMPTRKAVASAVGALAVAAGAIVATAAPALATTPPYEPDSTNQIGQLVFYDATGHRVTSGSVSDAPFAKYAVATTNDPQTANATATLFGYLPVNGSLPANWSGEQMSGTTAFPVSGGPGPIGSAGAHRPVVTLTSSDLTLSDLKADYPNTATDSYQGLYQIRVLTPGNNKWWAADIQITGTSWTQVYPTGAPTPSGSVSLSGPHRVGKTDTCTKSISNASSFAYTWKA